MDTLPVQIVFLTFLAGSHAHPHTVPGATCPTADQVAQCDSTNNFNAPFKVAYDPKTWTEADMETVCTNGDEFAMYMTCLLSAEKQCVGEANENYVLNPNVIADYHQFACQERHSIPGTCVTDNRVAIETCYANAVATVTTTVTSKCVNMDELEKCYMNNMADCSVHTRNVVDILLYKLRPLKCGCDVIKASLSIILLAAGAAIFASKKSGITL